jgi:hypothetical protein
MGNNSFGLIGRRRLLGLTGAAALAGFAIDSPFAAAEPARQATSYTAPLDWAWDSGNGVVSGSPTVSVPVHDTGTGHLALGMATNRSAPSAADQITSLGAVIGAPRDFNGQFDGPSTLQFGTTFRLDTNSRFHVERSWNSSQIFATVAMTLEDLDTGTVTTGPEFRICWNDGFNTGENRDLPTNPAPGGSMSWSGDFDTAPHHNFRAWVDLHAHVSAAGFGGVGGSAADLTVGILAPRISYFWYFRPIGAAGAQQSSRLGPSRG